MSSATLFTTPPPPQANSKLGITAITFRHPSPEKLATIIDQCKYINQLQQIHAFIYRHNLDTNRILNFKLQKSYSSLGHLNNCLILFNKTQNPNVFFYTNIIHTLSLHSLHYQAFVFYTQMLTEHALPNAFTFSSILKNCPLEPGKLIHGHSIKLGLETDLYVRTSLVDVYARGGDLGSACKVFDKMPEKNLVSLTAMITCYAKWGFLKEARVLFDELKEKDVVSWNVMIDGYVQQGFANEGLVLFRQMWRERVRPSVATLVSALSGCGQIGALESGRWVHSYIESSGIGSNARIGSALIDMYCKCGSLEDAIVVFASIVDKDVVVWNSMIIGYAMHGFSREALELFDKMLMFGFQPSDITFIGVLNACGHSGLTAEGWSFFCLMKEKYGIEPKVEHYGCMVNLLGRAGRLDEAYELVKNIETEQDPVLWGTLLGACRLHQNFKLGEEIAKFLISRDLANSGTYVLLSNMYAASNNWEGVAKVRTLMKNRGVEKEPGCSSIEVNNKIHEFLAGDLQHSKSEEIYEMLEEMNKWLKEHGYVPQTDIVLHDLGREQKEKSLEVHSEKLAIAYGLISTRPRTTLKIMKNLRVCSDCHAVTKLISKITGRKIVMRDRNRFHHFENGTCSCGDYW